MLSGEVADGVEDRPMTTCERVLVVLVVLVREKSGVLVKAVFVDEVVPPEEPATVTVGTEKPLHVCLYARRIIEYGGSNLYSPNSKVNTHCRRGQLQRK